jgi:predicted transcriptional regulator
MNDQSARDGWTGDRTTFQRVYDLVVGAREFERAGTFAERADCSETAARNALEQLTEMGIARRRDGRPATYRRNDSYFRWKRVESLADEHDPAELRQRVDDLIDRDTTFQERYGVPEPDAVRTDDLPADDHDALHDRWDDLREWRTVRRDIRVLRDAVERAESRTDDGVRA